MCEFANVLVCQLPDIVAGSHLKKLKTINQKQKT
jgi:hypothetical protein